MTREGRPGESELSWTEPGRWCPWSWKLWSFLGSRSWVWEMGTGRSWEPPPRRDNVNCTRRHDVLRHHGDRGLLVSSGVAWLAHSCSPSSFPPPRQLYPMTCPLRGWRLPAQTAWDRGGAEGSRRQVRPTVGGGDPPSCSRNAHFGHLLWFFFGVKLFLPSKVSKAFTLSSHRHMMSAPGIWR